MKVGIKYLLCIASVIIVVGYANFYALLPPSSYTDIYLLLMLLAVLRFAVSGDQRIHFRGPFLRNQIKWILFMGFALVGNQALMRGDYVSTLRFLALIMFCIALSHVSPQYVEFVPKVLLCLGMVNVAAVFFFFLFPSAYRVLLSYYGFAPVGTGLSGEYGYRAGIADHYSQNGMFLAITFVVLASMLMLKNTELRKRKNIFMFLLAGLTLMALIMTTKRGPLLFALLTCVAVYYILNTDKMFTTSFKIVVAVCVLAVIVYVVGPFIPGLSEVLARFETAGKDAETMTRFRMWRLAFDNFKTQPVFGIGWFGFRFEHAKHIFNPAVNDVRYMYLHAHNVYIQVLCESGIVGAALYIYILVSNLKMGIRTLVSRKKNNLDLGSILPLTAAVAVQIYYILYSFTGNCLYDMMFCFYVVAAGTVYSISHGKAKEEEENEEESEERYEENCNIDLSFS